MRRRSPAPLGLLGGLIASVIAQHHGQIPVTASPFVDAELDYHSVFPAYWDPEDYHGIVTMFGLPPSRCWGVDEKKPVDIAILGAPFDTATTFRPGARFGPNALRQGSRRIQRSGFSYNVQLNVDALKGKEAPVIVDCGDVPMSLFSNPLALKQLEKAYDAVLQKPLATRKEGKSASRSGEFLPRVLTLGGDHTVILPILRAANKYWGPVSVIHFDSHLDSWLPSRVSMGPAMPEKDMPITHGSMFWVAAEEGLIANGTSIHVGIRTPLLDLFDYENDRSCGFSMIEADEIEDIGYKGVVEKIRKAVGDRPVYISIDIDTIDPSMAPAGGVTTREMKKILKGLDGLKIIGADIVEVAPAYDSQDEITAITGANLAFELIGLMAKSPA